MKRLRVKNLFRSILCGLFVGLMLLGSASTTLAAALSKDDRQAIINDTPFYDPSSSAVDCGAGAAGSTTGSNSDIGHSGNWSSGLNPPYILEQMMIETLKDIAQKKNIPQSAILTENHVIAMVGFAMGEGGDINNSDLFNPMNTGINAPDLISGTHAGNGVQSFISFDAGVEALARTLVQPGYSRLIDVLSNPSSNPQDFIYALTYFQKYPNNVIWAQGSDPAYNNQGQAGQDRYYQNKLDATNNVINHYEDTAALVIGTPDRELILHETNPSLLQYHPQGGTTYVGAASNCNCSVASPELCAGNSAQKITQAALLYSWPDRQSGNNNYNIKPEYAPVLQQYNPAAPYAGRDCGSFVGTVMRATMVDPNYPLYGTSVQSAYVKQHPELYDVVDKVNSTAELQPGDILIVNANGGAGANGHTYIYVGSQPNGDDEASASFKERYPGLNHAVLSDSRGNYIRARIKT